MKIQKNQKKYTTNLKVFSDDKSLDEFRIIPIKISDLNPGKTKKLTENLQLIQSQTQDYLNRIHKKELPLIENINCLFHITFPIPYQLII